MDINNLIAIVKKKLIDEIVIEKIDTYVRTNKSVLKRFFIIESYKNL